MMVNLFNKLSNFAFILYFTIISVGLMLFCDMNFSFLIFNMSITNFTLSFKFDFQVLKFIFVIYVISFSVKKFSYIYMQSDLMFFRFYKLVLFFIVSMLILLVSDSVLVMVMGWDGLGLSSFLLVIYYNSWKSMSGSMVTLMMNRLGDAFMMITLTFMVCMGVSDLNLQMFLINNYEYMTIFFVLALFTKSAQVPFIMWLPEAMEAPTPVSALVHSSTLVTAGVYLMICMFDSLSSLSFNYLYLTLGMWTMLIGGMTGVMLKDSKKVVALSTLSQLGFMVISISLGFEEVAYFHVLCHAVFKALLFIIIGLEINFKSHEQNFKNTNNKSYMNLMMILKLISLFSLNAFPFFSGYYSKDLIFQMNLLTEKFEFVMMMIYGIALTILYSLKLWNNKSIVNFSYLNYNKFLLSSFFFLSFLGFASIMLGKMFMEISSVQIFSWEHWIIYMSFIMSYLIYKEKTFLLKWNITVLSNTMFLMKLLPKIFYNSFIVSYQVVKIMEFSMNEKLLIESKYILINSFMDKILSLMKMNYFYMTMLKWMMIILLIWFIF